MKVKNRKAVVFVLVSIALFVVLLLRTQLGKGFSDEICYIASLKRYLQGDRFLLDDWHPPTQLNTWLIFQIVRLIPDFSITVLQARIAYVCYQFVLAMLIGWMLRDRRGVVCMVFAVMCFAPYNIMALCYNTMAIGSFLLLAIFCVSRKKWNRKSYIIAGFLLCMSLFSNPYLILIYLVYLIVCIVLAYAKKDVGLFRIRGIGWVTLGAFLLGGIFIGSLIGKGSFQEYLYNIKMIFNDKEHKDNLLFKLFMSQWEVFRVYWRSTVVLVCVYLYTFFKRKTLDESKKKYLFCISVVFVVYGILRFSFIYGSIAVNMMMVPMTLLGVEIYLLSISGECQEENEEHLKHIKQYFVVLIFGYLFAVANYLGTNTEILSMSAMFIVPSSVTVLMIFEYAAILRNEEGGKIQRILGYGTVAVFLFCVLWLRLFFMWYDSDLNQLKTKITEGPCAGLYTTAENAQKYTEILGVIDQIEISKEDQVLFMPIEPLYYVYSAGEISTPYVTRFAVDSRELNAYFESHPNKVPTCVVVMDCVDGECSDEEEIVLQYFIDQGYRKQAINDQVMALYKN